MSVKKTSMYSGRAERFMVIANTVMEPLDTLSSRKTRTRRMTRNTLSPGMSTPLKASSR